MGEPSKLNKVITCGPRFFIFYLSATCYLTSPGSAALVREFLILKRAASYIYFCRSLPSACRQSSGGAVFVCACLFLLLLTTSHPLRTRNFPARPTHLILFYYQPHIYIICMPHNAEGRPLQIQP